MVEMDPRYLAVFTRMALFKGIHPAQIERVVERCSLRQLAKEEVLFSQGERGDRFYIVISGRVRVVRGRAGHVKELGFLISGDHIGEEALLTGHPRSATIIAEESTLLLWLSRQDFAWLLNTFPVIKQFLLATIECHRLARSREFDWLKRGEETIYLMARKHVAYLYVRLIKPFLLTSAAPLVFYLALIVQVPSIRALLEWLTLLIAIAGVLWAIWRWLDWGNDYYVVTNQRVVWVEKVIGLYDSRQEAPMGTLLTVGTQTDAIGRWLGYGNVVIRTYTGQIVMRRVGFPEQLAGLIEEHLGRSKVQARRAESEAMGRAIRGRINPYLQAKPRVNEAAAQPKPVKKPGFFANFFKIRFEQEGVVTYRKHWYLLLQKAWLPTLIILLLVGSIIGRLLGFFEFISPALILLPGFTFLFIVGLWWLYQYANWRNDIYVLTSDQIIDIYRTPLGKEDKKMALLDNILSLEHSRTGILGLALNVGNVIATVGAAKFIFEGVFDPAGVEQEIFERINARKQTQREAETSRERERLADVLAAYHREVDALRRLENPPNFGQNKPD